MDLAGRWIGFSSPPTWTRSWTISRIWVDSIRLRRRRLWQYHFRTNYTPEVPLTFKKRQVPTTLPSTPRNWLPTIRLVSTRSGRMKHPLWIHSLAAIARHLYIRPVLVLEPWRPLFRLPKNRGVMPPHLQGIRPFQLIEQHIVALEVY